MNSYDPPGHESGILSKKQILERLESKEERLVISPILNPSQQISGGSVNLRLGTRFIDTKGRAYAELDPQKLSLERIKSVQEITNLSFGGEYILHPRRLVLGCTFEFIGLPPDISGFVLTRSSYGRAGLMVATATYIHPGWKGYLTLELFNYGDFAIDLYCGSQIAQLVLITSFPRLDEGEIEKGPIAIGPQFSEMKRGQKEDWDLLEKLGGGR